MPVAPLLIGTGTSTPPDSVPQETSVQVPTILSFSDCPYAALDRAARQRTNTSELSTNCEMRISTSAAVGCNYCCRLKHHDVGERTQGGSICAGGAVIKTSVMIEVVTNPFLQAD